MVKEKTCADIINIFDELKKQYIINEITCEGDQIPIVPPNDVHYYIMSDSICIYVDDSISSALPLLAFLCMNLQVRLLCLDDPVLIRGSISRGKVYGDQGILFGPALVEAYLRSENLAHVPRIIIPAHLYDDIDNQTDRAMLEGFTYLESDGFYSTRYINYFCMRDSTKAFRNNVIDYANQMLNTSLDQSLREKYAYVKSWIEYFSRGEGDSIERPG